jgi:hypothetical protein
LRVPLADGTLVATPEVPDADLVPSLLTASDVLGTGWFGAVAADVQPGNTVAVVGDGAVGLLGVLAAKHLGAERIIAFSRHEQRQKLAREFGATDIVTERGDDGVAKIKDLTHGLGAHSVIEAVGTQESMMQAIRSTRPGGGHLGYEEDVAEDVETGLAAPSQGICGHRGRATARRPSMTKYLLLKHYRGAPEAVNAVPMDQWTPEEIEDHLQYMADFATRLEGTGEYVDGQALSPEGTFVRYDGEGRPPVTDGPFAETKDLIAGWMVIDVDTYERALALAGELSAAPGAGGKPIHEWLEVRPFLSAPPTVTE